MLDRNPFQILITALLLILFGGGAGCTNVFTDAADKTTDRARLYQAKLLINDHDYTGAIEQILGMTATGQAAEAAQVTLASAYAGRCGLDAITLALNLANSTGNLFSVLMTGFTGATASSVTDCKAARTILAALTSPSVDESVFLALVSFATIGAELAVDYDTNQDGTVDANKAWCKNTQPVAYPRATPAPMNDTDAVDVFVNLAYVIQGLATATTTIGGSSFADLQAQCAALPDPTICSRTNPALYTANEILFLRGIIASQEGLGLGICPDTMVNCTCLP